MDNEFFLDAGIPPLLDYNQPPMPTWHPLPPADVHFPAPDGSSGCFFDSALSSMVSSPCSASNSAISNERFAIRELIGKLGNICNSSEIWPPANAPPAPYVSANNSCYSTPLSSPPKADFFAHPGNPIGSNLPAMPGDSGFAERAARFSSFRSRSFNCRTSQFGYPNGSGFPPNAPAQSKPGRKLQRVLSSPSLKVENEIDMKVNNNRLSGNCGVDQGEIGNSRENSSVSEQTHPDAEIGSRPGSASRKRKSAPKAKSKQIPSSPVQAITKRIKSSEGKEDNNNNNNNNNTNDKPPDPPKDYIHVRARRGQATDSHSLAERVRREKISERMKLLQDIVPGCNKVTGKALMLEEIINYVQSLQRQVEFLSMKLASTPPTMDFNTSNPFQNDIFQPNCSLQTSSMQQLDALTQNIYGSGACPLNQSHEMQLAPTDAFINGAHELQLVCEGDLHTIVEMGFSDNRLYTG